MRCLCFSYMMIRTNISSWTMSIPMPCMLIATTPRGRGCSPPAGRFQLVSGATTPLFGSEWEVSGLQVWGSDLQYEARSPGVCITTIWHCRKPLNQWQCSFQMKAALPLANWLATRSVIRGPGVGLWSAVRSPGLQCGAAGRVWDMGYPEGNDMADSRFGPSQRETALLCNDVSHWLGTSLESALYEDVREPPVTGPRLLTLI